MSKNMIGPSIGQQCAGCGFEFTAEEGPTCGGNLGHGPFFWCARCSPPLKSAKAVVDDILWHQRQMERSDQG